MMKCKSLLIGTIFMIQFSWGQDKMELERRIDKDEFPQQALLDIKPFLEDARAVRYYRESDGTRSSFEVKLKKGKLRYSVEFDPKGLLEDVEIGIKEVDIPTTSLEAIKNDLNKRFSRFKIRKIQQQYMQTPGKEVSKTLFEAFQNLLLPEIRYEMIVGGKEGSVFHSYEMLYDAEGSFLSKRIVRSSDKRYVLY